MAEVEQAGQGLEQLGHVERVQAGGRLVEQEQGLRPPRGPGHRGGGRGEEAGELEPLGLAAGERRGRLAEPEVVEPHVHQRAEPGLDLGLVPEEAERLADGQVEHLGDRLAART